MLVLAAQPGVTSTVNSITRIAGWEKHLDREHSRPTFGQRLESLTRRSASGGTPQLERPTDGFASPCSTSHPPFDVMVLTAPTGHHCTVGALAVHYVLGPTMLVLQVPHGDYRRLQPYMTSSGPQCRYRRHSNGSLRTGVIYYYTTSPGQLPPLLRWCV